MSELSLRGVPYNNIFIEGSVESDPHYHYTPILTLFLNTFSGYLVSSGHR